MQTFIGLVRYKPATTSWPRSSEAAREGGSNMAVKEKDNLWAKVLLYDIGKMDEPKRKRIAKWLIDQAEILLKEHSSLDKRYRARYWK